MRRALIVVDIQKDFCPGGSLAITDGDKIIPFVNAMMFKNNYDVIVATMDWHPANHKSFASNNDKQPFEMSTLGGQDQVMWPAHCVQNTDGAKLHPGLDARLVDKIIYKGTNPEVDSYSGFLDNDKKSSTGLEMYLHQNGIREVDVVGLALDYCVKFTALDAAAMGFKVRVLLEGTKAVCMAPGDDMKAIEELRSNKVEVR